MFYAITAILSLVVGALLVFVLTESKRRAIRADREQAALEGLNARRLMAQATEFASETKKSQESLALSRAEFRVEVEATREKLETDRSAMETELADRRKEQEGTLARLQQEFNARAIKYDEYARENSVLKADLRNIAISMRKLQLDRTLQADLQEVLDKRAHELAEKHLNDTKKWITSGVTVNNYAACKQRLDKAIEWCREIGYTIADTTEKDLHDQLKSDYERKVHEAMEREKQAQIKAKMREEAQREREIQRELERVEREKDDLQEQLDKALKEALSEATAAHSEEVERLKAQLADAEARAERTISQAQLTKVGHIYVVSNIGSFGEGMYKIGMTRRLDPHDRIAELGDASVPFPFDVHLMISCEDAPALEHELHHVFHKYRVNKVNPRKEYFRVDLEEVRKIVEARCGTVEYTATPEAFEYHQSLSMSEEDQEYIEGVFEREEAKLGVEEGDE